MRGMATTDLESWRPRIAPQQQAILDRVWGHYRDRNGWISQARLHEEFGRETVRAAVQALGEAVLRPCVVDDEGACYRLTFLGVLLTGQGAEAEGMLARYLAYVRERYQADSRIEWVSSREVEAALGLSLDRSRFLRQLIRLSHWWGGGSGFGDQEWTVGVPVDIDELPREADLSPYVRAHAVRHFLPEVEAGPATAPQSGPRNPFWFVSDAALAERLAADWHEAQEVCEVRGWRSCIALCGGILEALLLEALSWGEPDPRHLPKSGAFRSSVALRRRPLAELVEVATDRGLLASGTLHSSDALDEFPALIRPARKPRKRLETTRNEATGALAAVRSCLAQLAAVRTGR